MILVRISTLSAYPCFERKKFLTKLKEGNIIEFGYKISKFLRIQSKTAGKEWVPGLILRRKPDESG